MVGTRNSQKAGDEDEKAIRLRNQEPEASDSDSDDAPEEVGFVASKKSAASLRKQEVEAKKQAIEALKEQRKRRQKSQKAPEPEKEATATDDSDDEDSDQEEDNEDIDMLPDEVLDALVDDEAYDRRLMQKRIISEQLRLKRKPKQRKTFSERQVGPVTVQVLKRGTKKKASEAARSFLDRRLHGGVKRSNEMLQPTKIGGMFVFGPTPT